MFRSLLPTAALLIALIAPASASAKCRTHACWQRVHKVRVANWVRHHYWRHERHHLDAGTKGWLARLRFCESTDNYRTNTGNGYYGAYQYGWGPGSAGERAGFRVRPDLASPAEQDVRTARFYPSHAGEWDPRCRV